MKAVAVTLGTLALSSGFADHYQEEVFCDSPSCCSVTCCASPTPCKDIDCTCFTPQWYNMACDCGFFGSVDFLYFYGKETNLSYAAKIKIPNEITFTDQGASNFVGSPTKFEYLDAKWDPGVRVGFGWNMPCDGWDLVAYWTYYRNTSSQSKSVSNPPSTLPVPGGSVLISQWRNTLSLTLNPDGFVTKVKGNWEFCLNNLDLVVGKRYWLSRCFTLRPFGGLRFFWSETDFTVKSSRPAFNSSVGADNQITIAAEDKFRNKTWASGLVAGIEPTWFFSPCFSLYSGWAVALGWGNHKLRKEETYSVQVATPIITGDYSQNFVSRQHYLTPMLDVELGLRWENYYCQNQYHLQVDLGWEHHVLFHLNDRYQVPMDLGASAITVDANGTVVQANLTYTETHHDVSFGGLVLRFRVDF